MYLPCWIFKISYFFTGDGDTVFIHFSFLSVFHLQVIQQSLLTAQKCSTWAESSIYDWYLFNLSAIYLKDSFSHTPLCHWSLAILWPPGAGPGSGCCLQGSPPTLSSGLSSVWSRHQPEGRDGEARGDSASSPWGSGCASAPGSSGCPYGRHSPLCNYWRFSEWERRKLHWRTCDRM